MSNEKNPILKVDPEDLIPIETIEDNPIAFFTDQGRIDKIVSMIDRYADESYLGLVSTHGDMTVAANRQKFISLATKIRSAKVTLRKLGEDTAREARKLPNTINGVYKPAVETLNELETRMRMPVTEWEEVQQKAEEEAEAILKELHALPNTYHQTYLEGENHEGTIEEITAHIAKLQESSDTGVFPEVITQLEKEDDYSATLTNTIFQLMGVLAQCKELEAKRIRELEEAEQRAEEERKRELERQNQLMEEEAKRRELEGKLIRERAEKAEEIRKAEEAAKEAAYLERLEKLKLLAVAVNAEFTGTIVEFLLLEDSEYYVSMVEAIERDLDKGTVIGEGRFALPTEIISLKVQGADKILNCATEDVENKHSDWVELVKFIEYHMTNYGSVVPELGVLNDTLNQVKEVRHELQVLLGRLNGAKDLRQEIIKAQEERKAQEQAEFDRQARMEAVHEIAVQELSLLLNVVYENCKATDDIAEKFLEALENLPEDSHVKWLISEVL